MVGWGVGAGGAARRGAATNASPTIRRRTSAPLRFGWRAMVISWVASGPQRERPSEAVRASGTGSVLQHPVVAGVRHVEIAAAIHAQARNIAVLADGRTWRGNHGPVPLGIALLEIGR